MRRCWAGRVALNLVPGAIHVNIFYWQAAWRRIKTLGPTPPNKGALSAAAGGWYALVPPLSEFFWPMGGASTERAHWLRMNNFIVFTLCVWWSQLCCTSSASCRLSGVHRCFDERCSPEDLSTILDDGLMMPSTTNKPNNARQTKTVSLLVLWWKILYTKMFEFKFTSWILNHCCDDERYLQNFPFLWEIKQDASSVNAPQMLWF